LTGEHTPGDEIMKKIINTLEFIHNYGIYGFTRESYHRLIDNYYEKYFNVNTAGMISKEDLGITHDESGPYTTLHYKHIFNMLTTLPVDKGKSTILDYGCGKGRAIVAAAAYKYQKIIGVELSPLIEIAKNNIDNMKHRKTNSIEVKQCDALDFSVPHDVNIIYFFNPFKGSILESVTRSIYSSFKDTPRKIYIIYFNNDHFDKIITHQAWLTKIDQSEVHPNISCGLYET
jgi:SAM-dependent methyltransferase